MIPRPISCRFASRSGSRFKRSSIIIDGSKNCRQRFLSQIAASRQRSRTRPCRVPNLGQLRRNAATLFAINNNNIIIIGIVIILSTEWPASRCWCTRRNAVTSGYRSASHYLCASTAFPTTCLAGHKSKRYRYQWLMLLAR